jgi:hypothetical protein
MRDEEIIEQHLRQREASEGDRFFRFFIIGTILFILILALPYIVAVI